MGEVQNHAGALVQHVGIEATGMQQGDVTLEPQPYGLEPFKFTFEHLFPPLKIGTRLKAMIAGLKVIGEITGRPAGEKRKDESREPHGSECALEPLSGGYRPRFKTERPA